MYAPGTILDNRYTVEAELGQGGLGCVYLAHSLQFDLVAIKEMRPAEADVPDLVTRQFQNEASLLRQLSHPRLPRIIDYFEVNGVPHLVMDYIKGRTLAAVLAAERAPMREALVRHWAGQICEVLEYLHGHDPAVVFRDLKPGNIILDVDNQLRLIDFGISKLFDVQAPEVTRTFARLASPGFAAPEQYGDGTDTRSDLYSLGATLYCLLTKTVPASAVLRAADASALAPLRRLRPDLSPAFAEGVEKLMTLRAADRPSTVDDARRLLGLQGADEGEADYSDGGSGGRSSPFSMGAPVPGVPAPQHPFPFPPPPASQSSPLFSSSPSRSQPGGPSPAPLPARTSPTTSSRPMPNPPTERVAFVHQNSAPAPAPPPAPAPAPLPSPTTRSTPASAPASSGGSIRPVPSVLRAAAASQAADNNDSLVIRPSAPVWPPPPVPIPASRDWRPVVGGVAALLICVGAWLVWPMFHHGPSSVPTPGAGSPQPSVVAPVAARGQLELSTEPSGANVELNGKTRGVTFLTVTSLADGDYVLRITKDGFETIRRDVSIRGGETVALDLALVPIKHALKVSVMPGNTQLSVDGKLEGMVGETPTSVDIGAGKHRLTFAHAGYVSDVRDVVIHPDQGTVSLSFKLTRVPAPTPSATPTPTSTPAPPVVHHTEAPRPVVHHAPAPVYHAPPAPVYHPPPPPVYHPRPAYHPHPTPRTSKPFTEVY